jgi:hypothetical protein
MFLRLTFRKLPNHPLNNPNRMSRLPWKRTPSLMTTTAKPSKV